MKLAKINNRLLFLSPTVQAGWENQSFRTDFEHIKTLGKGSFGIVFQAKHKKTGKIYAIKEIKKKSINSPKLLQHVKTQVRIMYLLNHPNIVKLYNHFEDDFSIFFVLEFAQKGQLYRFMMNQCPERHFSEQMASKYIKQVVQALIYIHSHNVIHRDIKPQNILIDKQGNLKLADFGWSNFVEEPHSKRQTYCGTLDYLAPEMIESSHQHDYRVDIWSIGVLIYELIVGFSPFSHQLLKKNDMSELKVKQNIRQVNFKIPSGISLQAQDLISKILIKQPTKRLELKEILNHPWIIKYQPKLRVNQEQNLWYVNVKKEFNHVSLPQKSEDKTIQAFTQDQIYKSTRLQGILNKKIHQNLSKQTQNAKLIQQLQLKIKHLELQNKTKNQQLEQLRLTNQKLKKHIAKDVHEDCRQKSDRLMQTIREQGQQIKNMHLKILENQRKLREYAQK